MTFEANHNIGEQISVPNPVIAFGGEVTGTIQSITFTSPTNPSYSILIPEQEQTVTSPAQTIESGLDG